MYQFTLSSTEHADQILIACGKVVRMLRAFVFLQEIKRSGTSVKILRNVFVIATHVKIGKICTI